MPAHIEPQPEGQTVEAAAEIKPQETTEQPVASGEALPETSGENGEAAGDKSNVENGDGGEDVPVDDGIQPPSSVKTNTEAVPPVKPPEEPLAKTTSEKMEEPADVAVDPSNRGYLEVGAAAAVDGTVESHGAAEIIAAAETPAEPEGGSCEEAPAEHATEETVAALPESTVDTSTETVAVKSTAPAEDVSVGATGASVPDIMESVSEPPSQPACETIPVDSCRPAEAEGTGEVVAVAQAVVESLPAEGETTEAEEAAPDNAALTVPDVLPGPSAPPDAETTAEKISEEHSGGAAPEVTTEAAFEVAIESPPVISAGNETTQEKEPPTEEVAECHVQSTVEQSIDQTPESAVVESDDKNVFEPTEASDAEAFQEKVVDRNIKLTDAFDVEIPETVPEPKKDPDVPSEEPQCNGINISEDAEKPAEELNSTTTQNRYRYAKGICSFCDQKIDGTVKISLSDPHVESHPDCLKCGVCALVLGDMLTPMFLHGQVIKCGTCFEATFKI